MNNDLLKYLKINIFPLYDKNDNGHNAIHLKNVIERSLKLAPEYNLDLNMAYTIAAYHDCGCYIDRENHEKISANIFINDNHMKQFFNEEQMNIIKEAIEDHRASLETEPRSMYGKIICLADKNTSVEMVCRRSYEYSKNSNPNRNFDEIFNESYAFMKKKFGENGYSKPYIEDDVYKKYIKELRSLLADKEKMKTAYKKFNKIKP